MKQTFLAVLILALAIGGAATWHYWPQQEQSAQRQRPPSKVNVVTPDYRTVRDSVNAVSTLRALRQADITSEISGRVTQVSLSSGRAVEAGDLLVQLDDRQARADLEVAEANLEDARRELERAKRLRSNNSVSQSTVDELQTAVRVAEAQLASARTRLGNHRIIAPFSGRLGLSDLQSGTYLTAGQAITTLDQTSEMELAFAVPERFLASVSLGQEVSARSPAFPDQSFSGSLFELGSRVDERSRSLPVRARVPNPQGTLRPGQFMSVELILQERRAMAIPEQAIVTRGEQSLVFVAEDGKARRQPVTLGSRMPGYVEVTDGLTDTDRVIVTGQDRLSSGDAIRAVEGEDAIPPNRLALAGED